MSIAAPRLHVRESGTGRPILFLHGWSCHGGFFDAQRAALADGFHTIAPDLPGHGATGTSGPDLTIEATADACADMLAGRDLSGVVVVGWSMGAHVAYAMLQRHAASRIAGLVVLDMTAKILNDDDWRLGISGGFDAARNALALRLMRTDWSAYAAALTRNMFADAVVPQDPAIASLLTGIRRNDPASMTAMWTSLAGQDFRPLLPRLTVPTLIAHGAKSRIYAPAVARFQADTIPDARIETFAASGHSPHLEEPEAFAAMLRGFASSV